MKTTRSEKIFYGVNYILLTIISLITLYPLIYIVSASISSGDAYAAGKVILLPKDITFAAYKEIFKDSSLWVAYGNTIFYTLFGSIVNLVLTILTAYPLSRGYLPGKKIFTKFLVFTMWFNVGMIPFYLTMKEYGLLDSRWGIIIGFGIQTFNVILMKNFFESVPEAIEEAAKIDGANDFYVLWKVVLPVSIPAIATIALYYAVSRWNGYFWAMLLLQSDDKIPVQVLLKKLIITASTQSEYATINSGQQFSSETIIYATIIVSIIPIIIVYPYIQKYFVKGIMVGSVKG